LEGAGKRGKGKAGGGCPTRKEQKGQKGRLPKKKEKSFFG